VIGSVEVALLILLAIIIAGPILAERLKVPGLIGLIFLGMSRATGDGRVTG